MGHSLREVRNREVEIEIYRFAQQTHRLGGGQVANKRYGENQNQEISLRICTVARWCRLGPALGDIRCRLLDRDGLLVRYLGHDLDRKTTLPKV